MGRGRKKRRNSELCRQVAEITHAYRVKYDLSLRGMAELINRCLEVDGQISGAAPFQWEAPLRGVDERHWRTPDANMLDLILIVGPVRLPPEFMNEWALPVRKLMLERYKG